MLFPIILLRLLILNLEIVRRELKRPDKDKFQDYGSLKWDEDNCLS